MKDTIDRLKDVRKETKRLEYEEDALEAIYMNNIEYKTEVESVLFAERPPRMSEARVKYLLELTAKEQISEILETKQTMASTLSLIGTVRADHGRQQLHENTVMSSLLQRVEG